MIDDLDEQPLSIQVEKVEVDIAKQPSNGWSVWKPLKLLDFGQQFCTVERVGGPYSGEVEKVRLWIMTFLLQATNHPNINHFWQMTEIRAKMRKETLDRCTHLGQHQISYQPLSHSLQNSATGIATYSRI